MSVAAQRVTHGNVAYDLSRFDNRRRVRDLVEAEEMTKRRVRERQRAKAVARPRVSVWAVLGFVVGMVLMFMIVFAQMNLAEMGVRSKALSSEISRLDKEYLELASQWKEQVKLADIRRIAIEELGMVEPVEDQILYINLSGKDHAVAVEIQDKGLLANVFGG